jgi:hypothetical protein
MAHRGSPKTDCCSNDGSEGDHSEGDCSCLNDWCEVSEDNYSGDISEEYSGDNHSDDDDTKKNREEVSLTQRIGKRKGAERAERVSKRLCTHPEDTGATDQNYNSKGTYFICL